MREERIGCGLPAVRMGKKELIALLLLPLTSSPGVDDLLSRSGLYVPFPPSGHHGGMEEKVDVLLSFPRRLSAQRKKALRLHESIVHISPSLHLSSVANPYPRRARRWPQRPRADTYLGRARRVTSRRREPARGLMLSPGGRRQSSRTPPPYVAVWHGVSAVAAMACPTGVIFLTWDKNTSVRRSPSRYAPARGVRSAVKGPSISMFGSSCGHHLACRPSLWCDGSIIVSIDIEGISFVGKIYLVTI